MFELRLIFTRIWKITYVAQLPFILNSIYGSRAPVLVKIVKSTITTMYEEMIACKSIKAAVERVSIFTATFEQAETGGVTHLLLSFAVWITRNEVIGVDLTAIDDIDYSSILDTYDDIT